MFHLAIIYSKGKHIKKNLSKSKELLEKASKLNHDKSSYYLGKLYLSRKSHYYNLIDAFNSFAKAANNNYAPAQNMIGQFFYKGIVIETDYKKAVSFFEKSSKQGFIDAQCNLSLMYATGRGVFINFGRAHAFAKNGVKQKNKKCLKVWRDYKLYKYKEDKSWKFNSYTKP